MTTAARATYFSAKGGNGKNEKGLGVLSTSYSSKDLPSHTKLKYRQEGQGSVNDLKYRDFREEFTEKGKSVKDKKYSGSQTKLAIKEAPHSTPSSTTSKSRSDCEPSTKKRRTEPEYIKNLDADCPNLVDSEDEVEDDDDDDDDDDFEDDDLQLELMKLRKEKEEEKKKKEAEKLEEREQMMMNNLVNGLPLHGEPAEFKVKRSWLDDSVFKNCAKVVNKSKKPTYINDSTRSEFHRNFLRKYVK